jgi:hypothetical protein
VSKHLAALFAGGLIKRSEMAIMSLYQIANPVVFPSAAAVFNRTSLPFSVSFFRVKFDKD